MTRHRNSASADDARSISDGGGVLVVGLAHSCKTEVRLMLETSPRMFGVRGVDYWTENGDRWAPLTLEQNRRACLLHVCRSLEAAGWQTAADDLVTVSGAETRSFSELLAHVHQSEAHRRGKDMWCAQVGGAEPVLLLHLRELPELKVIHTVRDPRDRLSLSRSAIFPGRRGWDLGRWEHSVRTGLALRKRFPDRYMMIAWEDLRDRPNSISDDLGAFLGCRLDPSTVRRPSKEKLSRRGGIGGPGAVREVRAVLADLGLATYPTEKAFSLRDSLEIAGLRLYRRVHRQPTVENGERAAAVSP